MKSAKRIAQIAVILLLLGSQAKATNILVSDSGGDYDYGYGYSRWDNFTAALDSASADGVDVAPNFLNLAQIMSYDALLLDQRFVNGYLGSFEAGNISAFIATGRRVLLIGENDIWTTWNNQILGLTGGTYAGTGDGSVNSVLTHELTAGAPTLSLIASGTSTNAGTALYDQSFATLSGPSNNVLTILDTGVWEDDFWETDNGGVFGTNVAVWLAGPINPVPEPTTMTLLGLGFIGLAARARRYRDGG